MFIIGNSSTGIREASYFNVPCINIGTRQLNRSLSDHINNIQFDRNSILSSIKSIDEIEKNYKLAEEFGNGNSDQLFYRVLDSKNFWESKLQKQFQDIF